MYEVWLCVMLYEATHAPMFEGSICTSWGWRDGANVGRCVRTRLPMYEGLTVSRWA